MVIGVLFLLYLYPFNSDAKSSSIEKLLFDNSDFVKVDEIDMHFRIWNPIEGNLKGAILLLHGMAGSTYSWRFTAPYLAENGYLVLVPDLPGFGLSQRKPSILHSHENRAEILWKLIDELDLSKKWVLIGHSMGGGIVSAMSLQRSDDTRALVLVDGTVSSNKKGFFSLLSRCKLIRNITSSIVDKLFVTRKKIKSFLNSAYGRLPTKEEIEAYYQPLKIKNTKLTYSSLLRKYKSDSRLEERIGDISIPVLGIWGQNDKWVPLKSGEKIIQKISNAQLSVIEGASHCPMETHPVLFNQKLIDFLEIINL